MAYNPLRPVKIVSDGDMSADIESNAIEIIYQDNVAVQLVWTGTPVGTFSFQVSNDHIQDMFGNVINAGNWVTLPLDPAITASGAGDDALVDLNQLGAAYVRVVYTAVSGSGVLNVTLSAKGV